MSETSLYRDLAAMEPLFPEGDITHLEGLAAILISKAKTLEGNLHPITRNAVVELLKPMNSYYSNLIEGHDTNPIDIENALNDNYSTNKEKRNLQIEAYAHIKTYEYVADQILIANSPPCGIDFIKKLHFEFYKNLPEEFLNAHSTDGVEQKVIPGEFRSAEVIVGRHVAPAHDCVTAFMEKFESKYSALFISKNNTHRVISIAAAHHRLAWIHPFLDGNGRVVRLFSDACFMNEDLHADGLWSISRGLARTNSNYKQLLANADHHRINDYDGHGNLSNRYLIEFIEYFLSTAIDQLTYMNSVLELDVLYNRIEYFCELMITNKTFRTESKYILLDLFAKGKLSKVDAMRITTLSDKTLKLVVDKLVELQLLRIGKEGVMVYYYPKYPVAYSPYLFPGLFPASKEAEMIEGSN